MVNTALQFRCIRDKRSQRYLAEKAVAGCSPDAQAIAHQHRIGALHIKKTS